MTEYIVRESGFPGTIKQEIVGELVRCKDCEHHKNAPKTTDVWCDRLDGLLPKDWFCADGERREEDRLVMPPADGSTIKVDGERRTDDGEIH